MWAAPELLGAPTMAGGSAQPGDSGGESHRSQINLPSRPKYMQIVKNGRFHALLAYKSPKTPFFVEKYLTKYNHKAFFEEYINLKKIHYLSHCRVIPLQSFGSHIPPPPPGLGLRTE